MTGNESAVRPARTTLVLDRTFGPWFWGNLVSNTGNWLFNVVASIELFRLTGSATWVAFVSVSQFLPLVVLSPWAGALSDRRDRRRVLLVGQAVAALAAAALATTVLVAPSGLTSPWPVLLAALGIGLGQAVAKPAQNSLVPLLVAPRDLARGVSLTSLTFSVGRALGPASAGALLAAGGAEVAFVLNAVTYVPFLVALVVLRPAPQELSAEGRRWRDDARAGLSHAWRDRPTAALLAAIALTGFLADPAITLSPPLAVAIGGDDSVVAAIVSAFGVAAILGAIVAGRASDERAAVGLVRVGLLTSSLGLALAAAAPGPVVAVLAFAALGAGSVLAATALTTGLQRHVPDVLRGRVMALWAVAFLGTRPLAALVDGIIADAVGVRVAILVQLPVVVLAWLVVSRFAAHPDVVDRAPVS